MVARAKHRIEHIDFVKGALVLLMVLYHWLNYFVGLEWGGYRYLRFLTPSFIAITGFLVSSAYLSRGDGDGLHFRLMGRGLRLLALFVGLNVVAEWTLGGRLGLPQASPTTLRLVAEAVFIDGSPLAAFDVLVSIAYFLLLAPLVLHLSKLLRIPLALVAAVAFALVAASAAAGRSNTHAEMLSIAFVGLAAGAYRRHRLASTLRSPWFLAPSYVAYLVLITRWKMPYTVQVIGVCLSLLVLDLCAITCGANGPIQRAVIRLGQYSLFAYIAQIAVLQLLRRALWGTSMSGLAELVPLALAVIITITSVEIVVALRDKSVVLDRMYRAVLT